jgi:hypothetical protein
MSEIRVPFIQNAKDMLTNVSHFSPLIISSCVLFGSVITGTLEKAFVFFLWAALGTFFRSFIIETGHGFDATYSTFMIVFTMLYLMVPMIFSSIQNHIGVNYAMIAFFVSYFVLDLHIKQGAGAITLVKNVVLGILFGMGVVLLMYSTRMKYYLYINEVNPSGEVCSVPSKQQFRCNVYKNGELVGTQG